MIKKFVNGKLKSCSSLIDALELENIKDPVISFIGAGGKTTTIKRLAKEYIEKGIPVVVTTTTHLFNEEEPWFLLEASKEKALDILKKYKMVWIGSISKKGKMSMPDRNFLNEIISLGYPVLIEADGARRLPCKAPGENEPVYIDQVTCVVNVYGVDSIDKKIEETCFRPERVSDILEKDIKEVVSEKDIAILATDKRAGRKDVSSTTDYKVIINKVDDDEKEKKAEKICDSAERLGLCDIIITGE